MSNSTDFTSFHIPSLPSGTFTDSHCQYLNQQSQDFSGHQLITKHFIEHKRSIGSFTDRTDDLLSQSTNDSPANSNHKSRLDDSLLSPTILKRVSSIDCQHVNTITKRCTYCKDCGLFLPTSGSTVHRESTYNEKLTTCPDEVYSIMLQNETNNREYHVDAPHLEMRKTLTDWIFQVSQDLKLSPDTTCAIISYVDTILCREEVSKENLQLVILTCLIVATKFLEMDNKVPSMREAYNLAQGVYPLEIFKTAELHILDQLDWNLTVVSPFQYVHYYLSRGCVFSSDKTNFGSVNIEALQYLRKYSECFVNYSMDNYQFNQFRSHIVACAAIASTRKMIGISPLWNPELEELTGASWEDIKPCFDMLFGCFESSFPELLDFSKVLIEKNEKQTVCNGDGWMMTEAHKVCVKEESDRKILKNAISTKNKESSSRKKQSNKKHLARFNKKSTHQNKCEEPDALEITEEMLDQFSDSKGTGDVKTRL